MKFIKRISPAAGVLAAAALLAGVGVGLAVAPTPAACKTALQSSDTLQEQSVKGFGLAADAIDYASSWNSTGLDRVIADTSALADEITPVQGEYREAANKCDGGDR